MATVEQRIYRIISDLFDVPLEAVNDDQSPDTIEKWDSIAHINLVLSLEQEFRISFSPEEASEMLSVKLIKIILSEHGITAASA